MNPEPAVQQPAAVPASVLRVAPVEESAGAAAFRPRRVLAVDLETGAVEYPDPDRHPEHPDARVLVRWLGEQIAIVAVRATDADVARVAADAVWSTARDELAAAAERSGVPAPTSAADLLAPRPGVGSAPELPAERPLVTVTIASLRNVEPTIACVRRILTSSYEPLEVVVVDNDADGEPLRTAVETAFAGDARVRWAHEPRTGLSFARNKGLEEARGEIVVFTDDDVLVDRRWVERLVAGFGVAEGVACVTGAILPAEQETVAQVFLEEYGGFHKGFSRQVFNLTDHRRDTPLYPYDSGQFGSGANMAFRTQAMREMGGFPIDLGAGTLAHGGEDLDVLRRAVTAGHTVVYEPAALMWHYHRRSMEALRKQMFRYGVGLSATVTKWLFDDRRIAVDVLRRIPRGIVYVARPGSPKNQGKSTEFPRVLTALELLGVLYGPVAYLRSRRRTAQRLAGRPA
ncbi:glycosyltransferase [Geodermatophilus sp. CPCC 206100]|uniref:glycosyltransferase n=1 Tax=Geodermatophilus sp. CPCC 206100 TaxID=3020054 RepID=UPI003AFFFB26